MKHQFSEFLIAVSEGGAKFIRVTEKNRSLARLLRMDGFAGIGAIVASPDTVGNITRITDVEEKQIKYSLDYDGIEVKEIKVPDSWLDLEGTDDAWSVVEMAARGMDVDHEIARMVSEGGPAHDGE